MTIAKCPCCGHDIYGDMEAVELVNGAKPKAIVAALAQRKAGVTAESLFDMLYAHRADGGPNDGHHIISVFLSRIRKQLREDGRFTIKAIGWGPRRYSLVRLAKKEAA